MSADLKKKPNPQQILYQKQTFFRHTQRHCRDGGGKYVLNSINIVGSQTQKQKPDLYEEKAMDYR